MDAKLIPTNVMNPASDAGPKSKFTEQRVNSIFNVINIGYQTDFFKGNGIYCAPELGNDRIYPRAISNFGWKLVGFGDGTQITTGMVVTREGKEIRPAAPNSKEVFVIGWGQEHQETRATGVISLYIEPSSTMFTTNVIHNINELQVDDEITVLSGYMFPIKEVTKEIYELATGETVADTDEAIAACKPFFRVVNEHQESVLTLAIKPVIGQIRKQKRLILIAKI